VFLSGIDGLSGLIAVRSKDRSGTVSRQCPACQRGTNQNQAKADDHIFALLGVLPRFQLLPVSSYPSFYMPYPEGQQAPSGLGRPQAYSILDEFHSVFAD
jgi:hypothetical protein